MRKAYSPAAACLAAGLGLAPSAAGPQTHAGLTIEPERPDCVVAARHPRIGACVRPAEGVSRALLYFRAAGHSDWYYVEMTRRPAEPCFDGVLPKPQKQTTSLEYYFEAYSSELGDTRTEDRRTAVVAEAGQCGPGRLAAGLPSALVRIGVPRGAPAVPPGFSSAGVTAAGAGDAAGAAGARGVEAAAAGGASATRVLIVAGGVAAVASGTALALRGGDGASAGGGISTPTTTTPAPPPPTTTQPPGPTLSIGFAGSNPGPGSSVPDPGANFTMNLAVSIDVLCSAAVPNARLFVMLRRAGTTCVVSYADFGLVAGVSQTITVRGFVAQAACRPAPFTTDSVYVPVYDMNGSPTVPLGTASFAVGYDVTP